MNSLFLDSSVWLELLGHIALKGAGLLFVVLFFGIALHRVSAAKRYVLWLSALLAVSALTLAAPLLPAWRVLPKIEDQVMELPSESVGEFIALEDPMPKQTEAPLLLSTLKSDPPPVLPPISDWPEITWTDVVAELPFLWLLMVAALIVRLWVSGVRLNLLRRRCATSEVSPKLNAALASLVTELQGAEPRLLIGPAGSVPMVWGIVRPCLLLPSDAVDWSDAKLRAVLLHELAHLQRRDPAALLVAQLAQALHWFNPLAWLTVRSLRIDQERACDDAVLRRGIRASDYAQHLLDICQNHRLAPGLGLCALAMARSAPVEKRLAAILDSRVRREASSRGTLIGSLVIASLIALPLAMLANETAKGLRGKILDRHGVILAESTKEKVRVYPLKSLAVHLLGYTGKTSADDPTPVGRIGIEDNQNEKLGTGMDVTLTLDARVQALSIRAMRNAGVGRGAVVVIDPRDGGILAAASLPSYDPNFFIPTISNKDWDRYSKDKSLPVFDRCLSGAFAPGSAMLPLTALAGVSQEMSESHFDCNGSVTYGTRQMKCWIATKGDEGHGTLDLEQAMQKSCNCYWYQFADKVGFGALQSVASKVGFGERFGILKREGAGFFPGSQAVKTEGRIELAKLSFGQGRLTVTPMQMAVLAATVANGGRVPAPRLIDPNAIAEWRADLVKVGADSKSIERIRKGMWMSVNEDAGTAMTARSNLWKIAGKTGTAQFARNVDGKAVRDDHAWFIGFAPYDKPTLAFAVFVEGGKSGGSVCAPIAKRIVEESLALPADGSGRVEPVEEQAGHFKQIESTAEEIRKAEPFPNSESRKSDSKEDTVPKPVTKTPAVSAEAETAINPNWHVIPHEGRDYLSLENVKTYYHFDSVVRRKNSVSLRTSKVVLTTEIGSHEMLINGVKFILSFPVAEVNGEGCISRRDLVGLIDPVLRPSAIKGAEAFETVVIDPGHGGQDDGAKGIYGLEKDLTLELGMELKKALVLRGIRVVMTRETDSFQSKVRRVWIANETPKSIFISLHFNSGAANSNGIETFALVSRESDNQALGAQNIALATAVHAKVISQLKLNDRGIKRAEWSVLTGLKQPGILLEGGFVTNESEGRLIASDSYRKALAGSVADAIQNYRKALKVSSAPPSETNDPKDGQAKAGLEKGDEAVAETLRRAESSTHVFFKTRLDTVLRSLAIAADIQLVSPFKNTREGNMLITHKMEGSPFLVMESLCKANGLRLVLDGGIWHVRLSVDPELVGKLYPLLHTKLKHDVILKDLRSILDLDKATGVGHKGNPNDTAQIETKVLYRDAENCFYVVCTRLQHTWIEGYLDALGMASENRISVPRNEPKLEASPTDAFGKFETETKRQWLVLQRECGLSDLPLGATKLKSELASAGFPRAIVVTFTAPQAAARAWLSGCPSRISPDIRTKAAWPENGLLDANPLAVMQGPSRQDEPPSILKYWPVEPSIGYKGFYSLFCQRARCAVSVRAPDLETVEVEIRQWRDSVKL